MDICFFWKKKTSGLHLRWDMFPGETLEGKQVEIGISVTDLRPVSSYQDHSTDPGILKLWN